MQRWLQVAVAGEAPPVIPAKAGTYESPPPCPAWPPACAGVTACGGDVMAGASLRPLDGHAQLMCTALPLPLICADLLPLPLTFITCETPGTSAPASFSHACSSATSSG